MSVYFCDPSSRAAEWGRHLIGSRGGPGPDGWNLRNFEPEDRRHLTILQLAGGLAHRISCFTSSSCSRGWGCRTPGCRRISSSDRNSIGIEPARQAAAHHPAAGRCVGTVCFWLISSSCRRGWGCCMPGHRRISAATATAVIQSRTGATSPCVRGRAYPGYSSSSSSDGSRGSVSLPCYALSRQETRRAGSRQLPDTA
jgi:hypothetical protein